LVFQSVSGRIKIVKEGRTQIKFLELTEKGREVAYKLKLVFDDSVKVVPIPEKQYNKLQGILEKRGEETVEKFVLSCVLEKNQET